MNSASSIPSVITLLHNINNRFSMEEKAVKEYNKQKESEYPYKEYGYYVDDKGQKHVNWEV